MKIASLVIFLAVLGIATSLASLGIPPIEIRSREMLQDLCLNSRPAVSPGLDICPTDALSAFNYEDHDHKFERSSKRPTCSRCDRPFPVCVCKSLPSGKISLRTKVAIEDIFPSFWILLTVCLGLSAAASM